MTDRVPEHPVYLMYVENYKILVLPIRVPLFSQKCLYGVSLLEFTVSSGLEEAYQTLNL